MRLISREMLDDCGGYLMFAAICLLVPIVACLGQLLLWWDIINAADQKAAKRRKKRI